MSETIQLDYMLCKARFKEYTSFYKEIKATGKFFEFNTSLSISENLDKLALLALDPSSTTAYLHSFSDIFFDVISRWITDNSIEKKYKSQNKCSTSTEGIVILYSLARIISLAPEIDTLVELFLERNTIFQKLERTITLKDEDLEQTLIAFFRLVRHDRNRYIKFISPGFLAKTLMTTNKPFIKYLSVSLIASFLNLAEKAKNDMIKLHIPDMSQLNGPFESTLRVNYMLLPVLEAKRLSNYLNIRDNSVTELGCSNSSISISKEDLSELVVPVCGVLVPRIHVTKVPGTPEFVKEFIPTERSIKILKELSVNIQHSQPIMLVGGSGSGKTFLIDILSRILSSESNLVKIHLGEQTDAKLLLGTYVSGERPGTFEWRSGALTTAVKEGRWVMIEDIDKAPTEVLSVLLSLLEKREIIIPSRGEVVKAANGFQLISTMRTPNDLKKWKVPEIIGLRLWKLLSLDYPSKEELDQILSAKFSLLKRLIPSFINLYQAIMDVYHSRLFLSLSKGSHPRSISVRDLIKFCQRVNVLFKNNDVRSPEQLLESSIYDDILAEAVDCFASAVGEQPALVLLIQTIGEQLQIATSRIKLFFANHIPLYEENDDHLVIGRAQLRKSSPPRHKKKSSVNITSFARTNHSLRLMEKVGIAVQMVEPVLLVGETGTGKTTVIQQVAEHMNKSLTVINVSQQTETGDLLGGYKPVNSKSIATPLQEAFEEIFYMTFSSKKNERFEHMLHKSFNKSHWKNVIKLWNEAIRLAFTTLQKDKEPEINETPKKKRRIDSSNRVLLIEKWKEFQTSVKQFEVQAATMDKSFVFNFVEGSLIKAVRNGDWLLLDEINLASPDTLESISELLSDSNRTILLSEKGDVESIPAHRDFRIFACMNPATDIGKRDLPTSIRSRFTEIYVQSPDSDIADLLSIIDKYISRFSVNDEWVGNDIAQLYLESKKLSEANQIVDGSNQRPHFSIRTLTRTLLYVQDIVSIYGLRRSLFEGFSMSFLTLLDQDSEKILKPLIEKYTIGRLRNPKSVLSQIPPIPSSEMGSFVQFKHYWMKQGSEPIIEQPRYIITPFVEKNLLNLVRATSGKRFPILVQGPTSSGKTSMIKYLAEITGHKFVRINNHEHTDLQEYLGSYVSDDTGKLFFKEGVLVEALRKGNWLVLDELNLAPTDVLEALNRLLDDNRELLIPETQEIVHPHPDFMLFATQNPPGLYGGRKVLSRAFRNRFLELHFDDIPQNELETILRDRCRIAPSYASKIVQVYSQLSVQRQSSRLFEKKNSFATLRDLFRWGFREAVGYEQLAANGYMLLAERVRKPEEKLLVKEALEKVMKVKLNMDQYYKGLETEDLLQFKSSVVWTKAMRRLAVLITTAISNNEPVLLVGETGCGKTTICQLLARFNNKRLITLNAHQNTETSDLLGAQRPVRNRSELQFQLGVKIKNVLEKLNIATKATKFDELLSIYDSLDLENVSDQLQKDIKTSRDALNILFEWTDGPLIQALNSGDYFLLDEISLADDSVLERLNSVLESERSLLLAEKGSGNNFIVASNGFQFFATMNPGGDYGKKELSPALRNRFTEIWVPSMEDFEDVETIVQSKLIPQLRYLAPVIVKFSESFGKLLGSGNASSGFVSLRDVLAWVEFINDVSQKTDSIAASVLHGAAMVFIDALGTNNTAYLAESEQELVAEKLKCIRELSDLLGEDLTTFYTRPVEIISSKSTIKAGIFELPIKKASAEEAMFSFEAPTTADNAMRVIRAMQVAKPILLEGSPGVGKTSLISALAKVSGNKLTRINLSEQTDLIDLFGSDTPTEGGKTGDFVWKDAPFLRAMQRGEWVLLDEMNLASQSILEGLNACLDHRGEAYIPELDRSFACHPNFLVIAAQNPQYQGGGRKGLPKSFVNRFTVVYVETLSPDDLLTIASRLYPNIDPEVCSKMIRIMSTLENEISIRKLWGSAGGPWEFNLRDTLRWLGLFNSISISNHVSPSDYADLIITQRFRSKKDKENAQLLINQYFQNENLTDPFFSISEDFFQSKKAIMHRSELLQLSMNSKLNHLQCNISVLESMTLAVQNNWPVVLVGPTNSGKTDLVRYLSTLCGSRLIEFSMNSDVDSMDILGGYEQVDLTRKITEITEILFRSLTEIIAKNLKGTHRISELDILVLDLLTYLNINKLVAENFERFFTDFEDTFIKLQSIPELKEVINKLYKISKKMEAKESAQFEWFDGLLVKAVQNGYWLTLDNANLCSPSVLDRLNSLLETDGTLIINECSMSDGQPKVLKPHPNFRLFLTVDPKFGELSRAMRNRGIELYIESLDERATSFDKKTLRKNINVLEEQEIKIESLSLLPARSEIPLSSLIDTSDSFSRAFALLLDTISFNKNAGKQQFISSTILPFWSFSFMKNISEFVAYSDEFFSKDTETVQIIVDFLYSDLVNQLSTKLYTAYKEVSLRVNQITKQQLNYNQNQGLLPLWNDNLELFLETDFNVKPTEILSFELVLKKLLTFSEILTKQKVIGLNGKLNDLSYLQVCAASSARNIKGRLPFNVFFLLDKILEFSYSLVNQFLEEKLGSETPIFERVLDLLIIWESLYNSSFVQDVSKFRVYQSMANSWAQSAQDIVHTDHLRENLDKCGKELLLKRGWMMSDIWKDSRGNYPSSGILWKNYDALIEVATEFDSIALLQYSESEDLISFLRVSLLNLSREILISQTSSFDEIFATLSKGIKALKSLSSKFLTQRVHNFQECFHILFNFVVSEESLEMDDLLSLSNQSGLGTLALIRLEQREIYPPIFNSLWTLSSREYKSFVADFFTSKSLVTVLNNSTNYKEFSADQLTQTVKDIEVFSRQFVKHSNSVVNDKVLLCKKQILNSIRRILFLETKTKISDNADIYELLEISKSVIQPELQEINDVFLVRSIRLLQGSPGLKELGQSYILVAFASIQLYVPDSPYDPAIEEHVIYESYERKRSNLDEFFAAIQAVKHIYFGDDEIYIETILGKQSVERPEKPEVYRSKISIDALFEEWNSFLASIMTSRVYEDILQEFKAINSQEFPGVVEIFQQNTSNFIERLDRKFSHLNDVNDIFKGYIYSLKLGFDLLLESREIDENRERLSTLAPSNFELFTASAFSKKFIGFIREMLKHLETENVLGESLLSFSMQLVLRIPESDLTTREDLLEQVLQTLYYRWTLRRMKKEKAEAEASSIFKFHDNSETEDDFKLLFPDYDDFLDISSDTPETSLSIVEDEYPKIAERYVSGMLGLENDRSLHSLVLEGAAVSKLLAKEFETAHHKNGPSDLSSVVLSLAKAIDDTKTGINVTELDFYHGYSISELQKSVEIVSKLLNTIVKLLKEFDQHATLITLKRIIREFLSYSVKTPVAKLLQKVEQIYTFVAEWDKYASIRVSLKVHSDDLTSLIVEWRKLELLSWKCLFQREDENVKKSVSPWWFNLFEIIILPLYQREKVDATQVVASLNLFLTKCTYGQFEHRLQLVRAFTKHASILPESKNLIQALYNVISFYEQFSPLVQNFIDLSETKLKKEIEEIILLASWKDVNVDALKQSSRRSHKSLYKIVRKYRDILAADVSGIIQQGLSNSTRVSESKIHIRNTFVEVIDTKSIVEICSGIESWNKRESYLKNIDLIECNMKTYNLSTEKNSFPTLYSYVEEIVIEMERLRKETPSQLTEQNKKEVAALKNQKRKLLSDTLRELRRIGLKTQLREDIHKLQESATSIISSSSSFRNTDLEGADTYFFRIIDIIPRLRASVSDLADDIPSADAERGLAIAEHLIFYLVDNKRQVSKVVTSYEKLKETQTELQKIVSFDATFVSSHAFDRNESTVDNVMNFLPEVLDYCIEVAKASSKLGGFTIDTTIFATFKQEFNDIQIKLKASLKYSCTMSETLKLLDKFITDIKNRTVTWKLEYNNVAFIADSLLTWIDQIFKISVVNGNSQRSETSVGKLEEILRKITLKILLVFQKIRGLENTELQPDESVPLSLETDKWFTKTQKQLNALLKALHCEEIVTSTQEAIFFLSSTKFSESDSVLAKSLFSFTFPIMSQYFNLVTIVLNKYKENYVDVSRSTYVLSSSLYNLCKNGFCSPEPPTDSKESDNLQEGTGLGDGEGAQNNSNEAEDDEDLAEDAQEPNKEKSDKHEDEENNDAVDIKGDMGGDLENASDQDENDDEGHSDEEKDELDEEIDDLDDLDPNAVDDKMWNEEAQDNSKEKDSETLPDNCKEDDMQAKEDEEDLGEKQKEDNSNDANQKEEGEEEKLENDNSADEEDIGEQEDQVKNDERDELEQNIPEIETLDLPDDINLDSDSAEKDEDGNEEILNDGLGDDTDEEVEEENNTLNQPGENTEMSEEEEEGGEEGSDQEGNDDELDGDQSNNENHETVDDTEESSELDALDREEEPTSDDEGNEPNHDVNETDIQMEENDENHGDRMEGIEGTDSGNNDDIDQETAIEHQSGKNGDGAQTEIDQEREDIGGSGTTSNYQDSEENDNKIHEDARKDARESLKQLGDSLKEFHRRHQEIKEASEREDTSAESANQRIDEFEHLEGENSNIDTQALGSANKDQVSTIDDDKAIDDDGDDMEEQDEASDRSQEDVIQNEEVTDMNLDDQTNIEQNSDEFNGKSKIRTMEDHSHDSSKSMDMVAKTDDEDDEDFESGFENLLKSEIIDDAEFRSLDSAQELWRKSEIETQELSANLCEQLRLILEPTLSTKLKGDYKTGKRLNMKKIIPYIASDFRKDKIWLKRTKPSKRQYQIMIAVDDSKSMSESKSVDLAFQSICLVSKALTQLESGELSIVRFGESVKMVHPFENQFTPLDGAKILQKFGFEQTRTDVKKLVFESIDMFGSARTLSNNDLWQLEIIISDGVCEDHETIQRLVRRAREEKIMLVFVVIDGINSNESIMEMSQVKYVSDTAGNMTLKVDKYLDTFPFEFYVIVHDITELPKMLSLILRQYFTEMVAPQ